MQINSWQLETFLKNQKLNKKLQKKVHQLIAVAKKAKLIYLVTAELATEEAGDNYYIEDQKSFFERGFNITSAKYKGFDVILFPEEHKDLHKKHLASKYLGIIWTSSGGIGFTSPYDDDYLTCLATINIACENHELSEALLELMVDKPEEKKIETKIEIPQTRFSSLE